MFEGGGLLILGHGQCVCSRPDRLRDIADRFDLDEDAVLDNVLYARAYTSMLYTNNRFFKILEILKKFPSLNF